MKQKQARELAKGKSKAAVGGLGGVGDHMEIGKHHKGPPATTIPDVGIPGGRLAQPAVSMPPVEFPCSSAFALAGHALPHQSQKTRR